MVNRVVGLAVGIALAVSVTGCGGPAEQKSRSLPSASGTLESVTVWSKPVQRPGEMGENSGYSPPKGSRVEVYDQFILITPPKSPTVLSPHGWYTDLRFTREDGR